MKKSQSAGQCNRLGLSHQRTLGPTTIILLGALCFSLSLTSTTLGQVKYNPDDTVVRVMADSAVASLGGGASIGEATLAAIAIVEHSKRYHNVVPRDNRSVNVACDRIVQMFPSKGSTGGDILNYSEVYFPALALILLAEVDDEKYSSEIKQLLKMLEERQRPNGTFTYLTQPDTSDTSQTQFAALAMSVAKTHDFHVNVAMAQNALNWLCDSQQPGGNWVYKFGRNGSPLGSSTPTLSMQAAGASSVYLLADFLQLYKRAKKVNRRNTNPDNGLPQTVGIYIKPPDGSEPVIKEGPLVSFDRGKLGSVFASGNASFDRRFTPDLAEWGYYYLYAVERYAYFREQTEGNLGAGSLSTWYDQGVDYLKTKQQSSGSFTSRRESKAVATAFAVLFLVRSSEIINLPPNGGPMSGNSGFPTDEVLRTGQNGTIQGLSAEKNLSDLLTMLQDSKNVSSEQLALVARSLKKQIVEFRNKDDKSRVEIKQFLRSMVGAKNYFRRLVAVKFLAGEQDMDNVPALLFALGDPDLRICLEAHDGLRLISRKLDSISISETARKNAVRDHAVLKKETELENSIRVEFKTVKKQWTDWFLKIRPGAELLD